MKTMTHAKDTVSAEVLDWLLDSDPAIRWQVLRDIVKAPEADVARERARVANEGWGAALLDFQETDGYWPVLPNIRARWKSTLEALMLLREFGVDPAAPRVRDAIERTRTHFIWGPEFGDTLFFEGETEACINGRVLAFGAYFGAPNEALLRRLLSEQLEDGGWNCEAPGSVRSSFHSTICVLEGLLEYERALVEAPIITTTTAAEIAAARHRGQEYLLERNLFRSRSTGKIIRPDWAWFAFPTDWHFDVLWGLDYLRRAAHPPDSRLTEAIALVRGKRSPTGQWNLDRAHAQDLPFLMEETLPNHPSRWITLRALRVLEWAGQI